MNKESILKRLYDEKHITFEELKILSAETVTIKDSVFKDLTKNNLFKPTEVTTSPPPVYYPVMM